MHPPISSSHSEQAHSDAASLRCTEPDPICSSRKNSGCRNSAAAKIYLLGTTFGFLSVEAILFLSSSSFAPVPPAVFGLPQRVLSCGLGVGSARSIAANERRLYEGVSCFPSQEQAALI